MEVEVDQARALVLVQVQVQDQDRDQGQVRGQEVDQGVVADLVVGVVQDRVPVQGAGQDRGAVVDQVRAREAGVVMPLQSRPTVLRQTSCVLRSSSSTVRQAHVRLSGMDRPFVLGGMTVTATIARWQDQPVRIR